MLIILASPEWTNHNWIIVWVQLEIGKDQK
jgi:hypothetical protein